MEAALEDVVHVRALELSIHCPRLALRRPADLGLRIDNLVRQPEFVAYLAEARFAGPVVVRTGGSNETWLSVQVVVALEYQERVLECLRLLSRAIKKLILLKLEIYFSNACENS